MSKKSTKAMSAPDREWRGQDDARTLARALEIKQDKPRLNTALKESKKLATDAQKEASRFNSVAGFERR